MAKSCTYLYKGRSFSEQGIKNYLTKELPINDISESIKWLSDYLNMDESEVLIIAGLIEGKHLGKLRKDSNILLSDRSDLRVAKHEAFHRVWRLNLLPKERTEVIREFKRKNSNWNDLIEPYKKYYPSLSENELIEEYFADEFEDYNPQTKTWQPLKYWFDKILNFLRKVLSLQNKDVKTIYNRILNKEFKIKKTGYITEAEKVLIANQEFTIVEKNDIVNFLTQSFVSKILNSKTGYEKFLEGSEKISLVAADAIFELSQTNISDNLYFAVTDDFGLSNVETVTSTTPLNKDSVLLKEVFSKLENLGIEIEEIDLSKEDTDTSNVIGESNQTREFIPSLKVNPKNGLSTRIRLLLSSFKLPTYTTTGVNKVVNPSEAFNQISTYLQGVPTSEVLKHLESFDKPYKEQLLSTLGYNNGWTTNNILFRNEFISKMSLTENKFVGLRLAQDKRSKKSDIYLMDLNTETRKKNVVKKWLNNLTYEIESGKSLDLIREEVIKTKEIKDVVERSSQVFTLLGVEVNELLKPRLAKEVSAIISTFEKRKYKNEENLYEKLDIAGTINNIADKQSEFETQTDLMITVGDNKIYALGLNTQQTVVVNKVKYFLNEASKLDIDKRTYLESKVPEVFNSWNLENPLLEHILQGKQFDIVLPYIVQTASGDEDFVDKLNEPDLASLHIHSALNGTFMSMKHSDRSTFFAYNLGKPFFESDSFRTEQDGIKRMVDALVKQVQIELDFAKALPTNHQYIGLNNKSGGYTALLGKDRFDELLNGGSITNQDRSQLETLVKEQFKQFVKEVEEFQLFDNEHNAGLSDAKLNEFDAPTKPEQIRLMLMAAFTNEVIFHIYESRLFTGDNRMFKSVTDLYKRLATQSSNGLLLVTDNVTNQFIRDELNIEHEVFDIETGKQIKINTSDNLKDLEFRAVTLKENDKYVSRLLQPSNISSKLGLENPTTIASAMEFGFLKDIPNPTEEDIKRFKSKIELAESKYSEINENDGLSYMTLPAFKNYMIRLGTWTDEMDVVYQVEMELLKYKTLEDAKDMEITIKGSNKYAGQKFKPFVINDGETFKKRSLISLSAVHTLKTQYAGISIEEAYQDNKYTFFSVFKTSQHLLLPSLIMGTNLSALNTSMLIGNVQIVHMGSANKVGGVDPLVAAQRNPDNPASQSIIDQKGLQFYKGSKFNSEDFRNALPMVSYLGKWEYLKDQVNIGNKEKAKIMGSTQSLKLMLSNLFINGIARFDDAKNILSRYADLVEEMVKSNASALFEEIGWTGTEFSSLEQLKSVILESSQIKGGSESLINQINDFFDNIDVGIETLPVRQKVENVLYALITRNIIDFKRPGNAYPQAASTGYEPFNQRKEISKQVYESQELDFYQPEFDNEGNLLRVKPAEVIIPLPTEWIPKLLKAANTRNLVTALNWLNNKVLVDKNTNGDLFIIKGLRIPNQQLSSNDIFRIKKFALPTMQSFAIVPSEIVIKVGSDFDIDKLNLYWTEDMQDKIFFDKKDNSFSQQLLSLEQQILLHPRNIQHLLMPLTNDIFVVDLYKKEFIGNKFIAPDTDTFISILNPMTNIKKAIIFVKGKFAVGIGAKGITFHTLNQLTTNQPSVQSEFVLNIDDPINPKYLSTKLRFANLPNQGRYFGNYVDSEGNLVSEIMSQLLTMYVDGVKEPYAVLMNITMQTANVVDYLIKAGLSAKQITFFLSQPLIKEYLLLQKGNESLFMKNAKKQINGKLKSRELNKIELLEKLLANKYKIEERFSENPSALLGFIEIPSDWQVDNLKDSLIPFGSKPDYSNKEYLYNQMYMLQHFLQIQQMSKAYGNFIQTQDSDTRGFADVQDVIKDRNTRTVVNRESIVSNEIVDTFDTSSVVSPFYRYGRRYYEFLFDKFYRFSNNTSFGDAFESIKLRYSKIEKGSKKERVMQTLDNDFILFVLHNSYFSGFDFDRLTKGEMSVAKQVKRLKEELPDNTFLKGLQPLIAYQKDTLTGESIDNLRFYEKKLDNTSTEDLSKAFEEIAEYSEQLYKDIIHLIYFQNGLNVGILNYFSVVPYNNRVVNVIKDIHNTFDSFNYKDYLKEFIILFDLNNPSFVPKYRSKMGHPLYKSYDFDTNEMVYYHKQEGESKGVVVRLLGNKNMKRYNLSYLDGSNYFMPEFEEPVQEELTSYKEVEPLSLPTNTSVQKGIEISSYSDDIGFALTNPTHTSPSGYEWKRQWTPKQIKWRNYLSKGIVYEGKTYKDVEQAYQQNKSKFSKEKDLFENKTTEDLMIDLLKIKLQTYPLLIEEITKLGGSNFILNSTHQPTTKNSFWETGGQNGFIRSLNQAYLSVINKDKPNQKGIDQTLNNC